MSAFDYRKYDILFVDDEEKARKYFDREFSKSYTVWLAKDGNEGLEIFQKNAPQIAIIVTDQRMPGLSGVQLLAECKSIAPDCIGILSTAYADLDAAIEAINKGNIYHYVSKPWDMMNLRILLRRAMEYYIVQEEYRHLMREKFARLQDLLLGDRLILLVIACINKYGDIPYSGAALNCYLSLCGNHLTGGSLQKSSMSGREEFWKQYYDRTKGNLIDAIDKLPAEEITSVTRGKGEPATWSEVISSLSHLHVVGPDNTNPPQTVFPQGVQASSHTLDILFRALRDCVNHYDLTVYLEQQEDAEKLFIPCDVDKLGQMASQVVVGSSSDDEMPQEAIDIFHGILTAYAAGFTLHFNKNSPKGIVIRTMKDYDREACGENLVEEILANDAFWLDLLSTAP